jgi:hypothetical protein
MMVGIPTLELYLSRKLSQTNSNQVIKKLYGKCVEKPSGLIKLLSSKL